MNEIIDLILLLSQKTKDFITCIELIRLSRVKRLKETWMANQDVLQVWHISKRKLQIFHKNGVLPYHKVQGKFYYKVSDIEKLLQGNYYNSNFNCDGVK